MGVISQAWTDYAVQVLPPTCPAVQRQETRRAFYAGAVALFSSIMGILEPGAEATEKDLANMDAINNELKQFQRDMLRGKA